MKPPGFFKSLISKSTCDYQLRQLNRAVTIENYIKVGIVDRQRELLRSIHGDNNVTELHHAICNNSVMHLFASDISRGDVSENDKMSLSYAKAQEILNSDANLEKLIIRVLYDIGTLGKIFESLAKTKEWANNLMAMHSRIDTILDQNRIKHPDMFNDHTEERFRYLFEDFRRRYIPNMLSKTDCIRLMS